jgi:hypothetical protein
MGLCKLKVQSTSTGFYILPKAEDKEATTWQQQRYVQKAEKYLSRSTMHLVIDSGAHIIRKSRVNISSTKCAKIIAGDKLLGDNIIFFEPIPEKFRL